MNLNRAPNKDELKALLARCDNRKAHHVVWAGEDGEVHVDPIVKGPFEKFHPDMQFRYETSCQGHDYVGPAAAEDAEYVTRLFNSLVKEWATYKGMPGYAYIDNF